MVTAFAVGLLWTWGCSAGSVGGAGQEVAVEFLYERHGGLCPSPDGGELCRLRVEVRDDGRWSAAGAPTPRPSGGAVRPGAASELASILEDGWASLTARPFTGLCPTAYDGSEVGYTVRRIPMGPDAPLADADVRDVRSCSYDLTHPPARAVLADLEALWRELDLPG